MIYLDRRSLYRKQASRSHAIIAVSVPVHQHVDPVRPIHMFQTQMLHTHMNMHIHTNMQQTSKQTLLAVTIATHSNALFHENIRRLP